ncbi:MAG: NUDIX hydrolase [Thermoanaerobaculaceae bacterium]|nr:NUDIX hydrolase [Thermoanaerobaculaceae bacterium]MDI9622875.1 NUDIX hydrolase [Acidobacteriota bacterium]NLH09850.1 NUDIX hydrolase [Holophagae bacterium]HPW54389.1 NUDIX hydrolase [Thermoanaerobaculaceae bacterium]
MPAPETPKLTADAVILDAARGVVLIRRGHEPFRGMWALPGGFVEVGETVAAACRREAREETGLEVEPVQLLGVYSDPARDPRGHTVSTIFICRVIGGELAGADDAAEARWFPDLRGLELAFDHSRVLADAGLMPQSAAGDRCAETLVASPPSDR